MIRKIVSTNLRFNMAEPDEKKAWAYLQRLDREKYKSYTKAVVLAVNEYFDRQARLEADPYLETRQKEDAFLLRVLEAVKEGARETMPMAASEVLARLFQIGTAQAANDLQQGEKRFVQSMAVYPSAEAQEDVDVALDFADGF